MKVQSIQPSFGGYITLDDKMLTKLSNQEKRVLNFIRDGIQDAPYNIFVRHYEDNKYSVLVRNTDSGMSARLYFNTLQDKITNTIQNIINLANINK